MPILQEMCASIAPLRPAGRPPTATRLPHVSPRGAVIARTGVIAQESCARDGGSTKGGAAR
ncbi:hypothetical protein HR12_23225 [Microbacterium sp. SUBG005]|nr:hypothetical protein HR12_23225 [Microbacterium sp. SUBG005]